MADIVEDWTGGDEEPVKVEFATPLIASAHPRVRDRLVYAFEEVFAAFEETLDAMRAAGATLIDLDAAGFTFAPADGEFLVLCFDFRNDLRDYFATRVRVPLAGGARQEACRMHGGAGSGAPRANRNGRKRGLFSSDAVAERRRIQTLLGEARKLLEAMK